MVILATTRQAFQSLRPLIESAQPPVWVGASVLTPGEISTLRAQGIQLTVFAHDIDTENPEQLTQALATVAEHHPDEVIWANHST